MRLVLASASPRRKELLAQAGYAFEVRVAGVDESRRAGEKPQEYVRRLALEKAAAVLAFVASGPENPETGHLVASVQMQIPPLRCEMTTKEGGREPWTESPEPAAHPHEHWVVLGADTTVVLDGQVLNKPCDRGDAERMLRALSGRTHQVYTGLAVMCTQCVLAHVETTDVMFREIAEDELQAYLESGDAMDKAGAYGIQGFAARWVPRIEGDYFNVVGLPIAAVVKLLAKCRGCHAVERDPNHVL